MNKNQTTRRNNYITLFFIATTIILAIVLFANRTGNNKQRGYDTTTVLNRIVTVRELALVKYNYTGVIGFKDYMKIMNINVPLTEKFFLIKYHGYIKAGVDFDKINVKVNDKSIHVSMPRPRIMDITIDEKSIRVYDESMNAFNPISITDYNKAIIKEKNTMRRDAVQQGILKDASYQAKLALTAILKEMGFEKIDITEEINIPSLN